MPLSLQLHPSVALLMQLLLSLSYSSNVLIFLLYLLPTWPPCPPPPPYLGPHIADDRTRRQQTGLWGDSMAWRDSSQFSFFIVFTVCKVTANTGWMSNHVIARGEDPVGFWTHFPTFPATSQYIVLFYVRLCLVVFYFYFYFFLNIYL